MTDRYMPEEGEHLEVVITEERPKKMRFGTILEGSATVDLADLEQ